MSKGLRFMVVSLSVVAVAAIAAWLAVGMSSGTASAQELLELAQSKNSAVQTYRFSMDLWQTPQTEGDSPRYETFTEGIVVANEGLHVVTQRRDGPYSETLLMEGQQYSRSRPEGPWEVTPTAFSVSQMATVDSVRNARVVDGLVDSVVVGEETLHGVRVTKIKGSVDLRARAEKLWSDVQDGDPPPSEDSEEAQVRDQMLAGVEEFVGWIGAEDGLIHAFEVSGAFPRVGELLPFQYGYRVEFSAFNEPLELPSVEATAIRSTGDGLAPTPTPVSNTISGLSGQDDTPVHPHDMLPWCDEIERPEWPEGVPTPVPSGPPGHASDDQPGNVRCGARPTETDTARPRKSESDSSTGPGAEQPYYRPTLDVDYDDSWVANIPATIGGYSVRFINTPKSKACNHVPLISLKVLPESTDGSSTPPLDVASLQKEIQSLPGVPERIGLSFSQGRFDPEAKAERDSQSNEHALEHGCSRWGVPIDLGR